MFWYQKPNILMHGARRKNNYKTKQTGGHLYFPLWTIFRSQAQSFWPSWTFSRALVWSPRTCEVCTGYQAKSWTTLIHIFISTSTSPSRELEENSNKQFITENTNKTEGSSLSSSLGLVCMMGSWWYSFAQVDSRNCPRQPEMGPIALLFCFVL